MAGETSSSGNSPKRKNSKPSKIQKNQHSLNGSTRVCIALVFYVILCEIQN